MNANKLMRTCTVAMLCAALTPSLASAKGMPNPVFFARPKGDRGPAIAYDLVTGRERWSWPAGMLSADGGMFTAATFVGDDDTRLSTFDVRTGDETLCVHMMGKWRLHAVAPDGAFAALARLPSAKDQQAWAKSGKWQTEFQIIDTQMGRAKHTLKLDGNFEAEALSKDGTSMFLVEHLPAAKPDHYFIRWYDLSKEQLVADPIRSKTADEIMSGYAWGGVASQDGDWLFTLYVSTNRKVAFIHMLNLEDKFTVCVDLPSTGATFDDLKGYALAYSPKKQTVVAFNARMGVAAEIKLGDYQLNGNKVVANKVVNFKPDAALKGTVTAPSSHSIVSNDGGLIYFAQGNKAYTYNAYTHSVVQPYRSEAPITGMTLSRGNRFVLISQLNGPPVLFDGHSGRVVPISELAAQGDDCPVTKPASFVPPNGKPDRSGSAFWHGTDELWTSIYRDGIWSGLPYGETGYTQKVFWWSEDYDLPNELQPKLEVSGKRLDAPAPPLFASRATNASAADIGSAMLVGVDIPTAGCWEITGQYRGTTLSFVVWVGP